MHSFVFYLLMPQSVDGAQGGGNPIMTFLPFIAIIAIFYFLIIRPQNKKQKETQKMLGALKKGDKIVTIGGIHGTIQTVKEQSQSVIVKVDENTKIEFNRSAISGIVTAAKEDKNENDTEASGEKE